MRSTVCKIACAILLPFALLADWRQDMDDLCWSPVTDAWTPIPNLIAHWLMNDNAASTTVLDNTGTRNGTAQRNTSTMTTSGKINSALLFTNKSDYVQFSALTEASTLASYCAWVYPTNATAECVIFGSSLYLLYMLPATTSIYSHNGTSAQVDWAGTVPSPDKWTHLALTQNGTTLTLYTNGISCGNRTLTGGAQKPIYIGRTTASGTIGFYGKIDDVRIYNSCISSQEVFQIFNSGNGTERE